MPGRSLRACGDEALFELLASCCPHDKSRPGLSILSGAHMTLFPAVLDALRGRGVGDVLVFGGGIIPEEDEAELKRLGVSALFKPGTSTRDIIDWVERVVRPRAEASRLS